MRKFKVKNRQKRKYTRKTVQVSSSSHAKSLSIGLLPLFIMAIALATTLLMSQAKGQTIAIQPFTLPKLTFPDVGKMIQNILNLLIDPTAFITSMITVTTAFFQAIGITIGYWTVQIAHVLDPRPFITALGQGLLLFSQIAAQLANSISIALGDTFAAVLQVFIFIGNAIATGTVVALHAITVTIVSVSTIVFHVLTFIMQLLFSFVKAIAQTILSVTLFIAAKVTAFFDAVIFVIEIPFKLLWKFWLQIKPFFDILGAHIQMTGDDLNNGFASWGKLSKILPPPSK